MYVLESEERWLTQGSLNFFTILQLGLFCQRNGKWGEFPYVQAFMQLPNKHVRAGNKLLMQRAQKKPPPPVFGDSQTSNEQTDNDVTTLMNPFNPNPGHASMALQPARPLPPPIGGSSPPEPLCPPLLTGEATGRVKPPKSPFPPINIRGQVWSPPQRPARAPFSARDPLVTEQDKFLCSGFRSAWINKNNPLDITGPIARSLPQI